MESLQTMIRTRGLRQTEIARRLGLSDSHFSEILHGSKRMPADKVLPLSKLLRLSATTVLLALEQSKRTDPDDADAAKRDLA